MRDWVNLQVIERLCILEKAQATLTTPTTAPTTLTTLTTLTTALTTPTTADPCNPFDFYAIYEHYDKHHYFEDVVPAPVDAVNINSYTDDDDDPDWFQLIQIEKVD
jgi:hypothetical protein